MDFFIYFSVFSIIFGAIALIRNRFASFRAQRPSDYMGLGPDFDLTQHLNGRNICEGVIFGPTGRVLSRFTAVMTGRWTGEIGALAVDFSYDSGATQHREWTLILDGEGRFHAEADDITGYGDGRILGPAVRLTYNIVLPQDAGGHKLRAIDWMYLTDSGTIVNRSQFRKFGFCVAELVATIRKAEAA